MHVKMQVWLDFFIYLYLLFIFERIFKINMLNRKPQNLEINL